MNRLVSSVRAKVERAFGTFKRNYHLCRARYLGQDKVELEFHLVAMAINLKKCWAMTKYAGEVRLKSANLSRPRANDGKIGR